MKKAITTSLILCILTLTSVAQSQDQQKLLDLDQGWEKALLESDVQFLDNILSESFIWVHNHASLIDGKKEVVGRAKNIQAGQADNTKGRVSRDQKVIILGNTGVVTGITVVDRGPRPVTYHFMRTYTIVDGRYLLLANHTMAIPDEELPGN
ncbi:nuclear transport factor 2 family protein [Shivajiella indica]|uniref:Nuclear transport factor 2 family protein n=1 Tax=Shivajiella indica TaxID=872115 RepID=A0ABW5B9G8_9BACT